MSHLSFLPFSFLDVTEQAALAAYDWVGRGDKNAADAAAVAVMRRTLNALPIRGRVVIGEGEMDEAPMLYIGEEVGLRTPTDPEIDLALDPLDGTKATAKGMNRALCVLAGGPKGSLLHAPDMYMDKFIVRANVPSESIDIDAPIEKNVLAIAQALGKPVETVGVCLLDRPRHQEKVDRLRALGARVHLISDGDVSGALYTTVPDSGIDMYTGIGGAPEGVIVAVAIACMNGFMQARLLPEDEAQAARVRSMGLEDATKKLELVDLVGPLSADKPIFFLATGVTHDTLLPGILKQKDETVVHTLVLSSVHRENTFYVRRCIRHP